MKIIVDGLDLCDAVAKVTKALSPKSLLPILDGIKLEAYDAELILTATDNELTIVKKIKAAVIKEGVAVVAGKLFADFVKKLNNEQIELEYKNGSNLKISYGDNFGNISCFNAEEFPLTPKVESSECFSIVKRELKDIVSKVSFCVGKDEDRPIFTGVLLEVNDYALNAVAIDGSRLAQASKPIEQKTALMSMIAPAKSINEISKILEDSEEIITVYRQKNVIMADLGHTKIISRLIDGEFINYKYIYPQNIQTTVKVSRERLLFALDRASIIARRDAHKEVKLELHENTLTMFTNSEEGTVKEAISVALEGKDLNIAFNASYIIDVLNAIKDEYIKIEFAEDISPCVVRPIKGDDYSYLILPTRPR